MNKSEGVSLSVIRRLPRYYRFLGELLNTDCFRISSKELSEKMSLTASQIRQDLNCFGGFGQQGYGYNVEALHTEIGRILGLDNEKKAILIGAGNLGTAIVNQMDFENLSFDLCGVFDNADEVIGTTLGGIKISHIDDLTDFCKQYSPSVALLCIPKTAAKDLADTLIDLGIEGFWNFSHYDLAIDYHGVVVENVHLSDSLMTLSFRVHNNSSQKDKANY